MHPITHTFTTLLVAILFAAASSNAADWQPGDILVADLSERSLIKAIPNQPPPVVDVSFDFNAPLALAVDGNGDIWVVDAPNRVLRIDHRSAVVTVIAQDGLLRNVYGIAVAADGFVYVTEDDVVGPGSAPGKVIRIDTNANTGTQTDIIAEKGLFIDPVGIAVGPDGDLYIADVYSHGGAVIGVNPATRRQWIVASGDELVWPVGLAFERSGNLVVVVNHHGLNGWGNIIRVDPVRHTQKPVLPTDRWLGDPRSITVEPNGDLLVADVEDFLGGTGAIIRVDPVTGEPSDVVSGSGLVDPIGIAFVPASVELTCPCGGPTMSSDWRNHGEYVTCVNTATKQWVAEGLITAAERPAMLRKAAWSSCGS